MVVSVRDIKKIASLAEAESCQLAISDKYRSLEIDQRVFDLTEIRDFKELKLYTAQRIVPFVNRVSSQFTRPPKHSSSISDGKQYCPQLM